MKAYTPHGVEVKIEKGICYGTSNQSWVLLYGDFPVAYFKPSGSGFTTLAEALSDADAFIEKHGLHEDAVVKE